jgi:hypothetical protein
MVSRNVLVAIAIANESKNFQFSPHEVVPQVLGNASRHVVRPA